MKDENTAFVIFNKLPQTVFGFLELTTPEITDQGIRINILGSTLLVISLRSLLVCRSFGLSVYPGIIWSKLNLEKN